MRIIVYKISKRFFLTSDIVRHIEARVSILYPASKKAVRQKVGMQLIKMYISCAITVMFLLMFADMSVYYSVVVLATIYVIIDANIHKALDKLEFQLLNEMLSFIENVKFKFQFDGMIEEALLDAINEGNYQISIHGQLIYNYLRESYTKDRCDYQEVCPNHFFLTFYSLCESVMKYGDKKTKEGSLFIKNLSYLKEDINIYILKQKAIENTFMGLTWICILPIYFMKPIELWAMSNMPALESFYKGSRGKVIAIAIAFISLLIYKIINSLKHPKTFGNMKKRWVVYLSCNKYVEGFVTWYMNCFVNEMKSLDKLLRTIVFPYNIVEFCVKRIVTALASLSIVIVVSVTLGFGWFSLIIGLIIFFVVYYGQILAVRMKKNLLMLEREDEIIRFQGIILMLMHADKITVEQILYQLERFASAFKKQIEEMSDKLSYKGSAVFREQKNKSDFLPFNRLIDGFLACDDMYIYKAFEDVEMDRRYYIDKHKQEKLFYIEQRGAISKFLSFIPLCIVIIVNLIVPFVLEGMKQLNFTDINL
ncbi:MAG: hypothetical protein U0L79_09440 [Lachnospiraceae bacterium]|nr:hypothetical protein [Lachnospiraceae bacterium]